MRLSAHARVFTLLLLVLATTRQPRSADTPLQGLLQGQPESVGMLSEQLKCLDGAVSAAIEAQEVPGAVVLVSRHGRVVYFKAFGQRALKPRREPMKTDTIFDIASLTKVMATTPSIMLLVERGAIRLGDKVQKYLPRFAGEGKDAVTVHQLLTHYSGLRPDFDLSTPWEGTPAALAELRKETTHAEPGTRFTYSDLNFIALGEIVRAAGGKRLDDFARENIYERLDMGDTRFTPPRSWYRRIAPTESRARSLAYLKGRAASRLSQEILRGEVHDPTAWRMGGVAGHAGLFSSARDLAVYAQMLSNGGSFQGQRIFSPLTVEAMTRRQSPPLAPQVRGLGWDIDTSLSSPRGDLFAAGYGHTGFTGTSLWIDPESDTFVILLSNRLHPDGGGDVTRLRGVIANIVAASISDPR